MMTRLIRPVRLTRLTMSMAGLGRLDLVYDKKIALQHFALLDISTLVSMLISSKVWYGNQAPSFLLVEKFGRVEGGQPGAKEDFEIIKEKIDPIQLYIPVQAC